MPERVCKDTREPDARNIVTSTEIEAAIEEAAQDAARTVRSRLRAELLIARALAAPPDAVSAVSPEHMTRAEYARRSRVSEATVSRWLAEGMPSIPVGSSVRIVPADADDWRRARGRRPTKSTPRSSEDTLNVDAALSRGGLRIVGSGS